MEYLLFGLADWRDVTIIAVGVLTFLVLIAILAVTVVLGLALRMLIGNANRVVKDDVSNLLGSAQDTVTTVKGTATFVSETTVTPIVRVYGVVAGARRAVSVIAGIRSEKSDDA